MKVDKMDGYCVGEPWNARAIADSIGYTVVTTQKMWVDHPEKVLAFTEEFASRIQDRGRNVESPAPLERVHRQDGKSPQGRRSDLKPSYINTSADVILGRMMGTTTTAMAAVEQEPNYMIFNQRDCNFPSRTYGYWWLAQFRRWGMVTGAPQYKQISEKVRPDIYACRDEGNRRDGQAGSHAAYQAGRRDLQSGRRRGYAHQLPDYSASEQLAKNIISCFLLPLVGISLMRRVVVPLPAVGRRTCRLAQNLGRQQDLHPRAVKVARRNGPGHSAHGVVLSLAGGERVTSWLC